MDYQRPVCINNSDFCQLSTKNAAQLNKQKYRSRGSMKLIRAKFEQLCIQSQKVNFQLRANRRLCSFSVNKTNLESDSNISRLKKQYEKLENKEFISYSKTNKKNDRYFDESRSLKKIKNKYSEFHSINQIDQKEEYWQIPKIKYSVSNIRNIYGAAQDAQNQKNNNQNVVLLNLLKSHKLQKRQKIRIMFSSKMMKGRICKKQSKFYIL